ncbi:MAG: ABC transporter permease subunit, partial [Planctomycetota bacterium]
LRARWDVHEVLSTILLNFVLAGVAAWVLRWKPVHAGGDIPQTATAASTLGLGATLALVVVVAVAAHVFLERTVPGLALRAVGRSPRAAEIAGVRPGPRIVLALALGGAAAGLGASTQVLGSFGRYVEGFSPGWGFAGIAVSMVAGHRPLLILPVALLFGGLRSGAFAMDALEVAPRETAAVIESSVLIAAAAAAWARPSAKGATA